MPNEEVSLSAKEWILVMLEANNEAPILGKTVFVKQLFVLGKELLPDIDKKFNFYPHHYGPYADYFQIAMNELINEELVMPAFSKSSFPENNRADYYLTDRGKERAATIFKSMPLEVQDNITRYKRTLTKLGLFGILNYVYSSYPEYAIHSRLVKRE